MAARCRRCRRLLTDPVYAARGVGWVCGGRIRTGRRNRMRWQIPLLPPVAVADGQLELLTVEEVSGDGPAA